MTHRLDYPGEGLDEQELLANPFDLVRLWVDQAQAAGGRGDLLEPSMLTVATVDADGLPDVRAVLMRFLDERGPGFVSATRSAKGVQLAAHPVAAATLTWVPLFRAIRFRGRVERIEQAVVEDYWHSRPWGSQISAHASHQSVPVSGRPALQEAFDRYAEQWPEGSSVPVPEDWAGWRIVPDSVEFWAGRRNRLHDRIRYVKVADGTLADADAWRVERLQP